MSGTTSPIRPEVFEEESGQPAEASEEEMIQHVEGAPWRAAPTHEDRVLPRAQGCYFHECGHVQINLGEGSHGFLYLMSMLRQPR